VVITPSGEHFLKLKAEPKKEEPAVAQAPAATSGAAGDKNNEEKPQPTTQPTK
jgi:hypothetical protein